MAVDGPVEESREVVPVFSEHLGQNVPSPFPFDVFDRDQLTSTRNRVLFSPQNFQCQANGAGMELNGMYLYLYPKR